MAEEVVPLRRVAETPQRQIPPVTTRVISDFVMASVAVAVAYWLRFRVIPLPLPRGNVPSFGDYLQAAPILSVCIVLVFGLMGTYSSQRGAIFVDELFAALKALAASALVVVAAITLNPLEHVSYSRLVFVYWIIAASVLIGSGRFAIRKAERRQRARGIGTFRCLVVGAGPAANKLVERIKMFPDAGYHLVRTVHSQVGSDDRLTGDQALASAVADAIDSDRIDVVFVSLPHVEQSQILDVISTARDRNVEFRLVPTALEMISAAVEPDQLAGIPLVRIRQGLDIAAPQATLKRVSDVALSIAALIVVVPVMACIGLAIKLTSQGPIVIRQDRIGINGEPFQMLKFRSMHLDAEKDSGPVWTTAQDGRRTMVGRFLRRFSLDELPQLLNVLRGDMSLVGPRPERPMFVRDFEDRIRGYGNRHRVRPGITGWAQVNDLRGMTSVEERVIYDLYYIERWSLAFDIKIMLTTAFRIFTSRNAY